MTTQVKYHLLGASDTNDTLDSLGNGTYKTLNGAVIAAGKEVQDKESSMSDPGARLVIVKQNGTSYEIVQVGVVPGVNIDWQK